MNPFKPDSFFLQKLIAALIAKEGGEIRISPIAIHANPTTALYFDEPWKWEINVWHDHLVDEFVVKIVPKAGTII